jgi:hypothetical protein
MSGDTVEAPVVPLAGLTLTGAAGGAIMVRKDHVSDVVDPEPLFDTTLQ